MTSAARVVSMLSATLSSSHDLISTVPPVLLLDLEFKLSVIKAARHLDSLRVLKLDVIRASALTAPALLLLSLSVIRNVMWITKRSSIFLALNHSSVLAVLLFHSLFLSSLSSVSLSLPWPYCNPITRHWSDACWQGQLDADDAKHHAISGNYFFKYVKMWR